MPRSMIAGIEQTARPVGHRGSNVWQLKTHRCAQAEAKHASVTLTLRTVTRQLAATQQTQAIARRMTNLLADESRRAPPQQQ